MRGIFRVSFGWLCGQYMRFAQGCHRKEISARRKLRFTIMECLIFSDSHGYTGGMRRVLRSHPAADVVFFLGDGLSDLAAVMQEFPAHTYLPVRGNCDWQGRLPGVVVEKCAEITLEGTRIVYTHGDLYGVKYGEDGLCRLAEECRADIVLFGHTHCPYEKNLWQGDRLVRLFNPGSIGEPPDGVPSFGLLTLTGSAVLFSHGQLT